MATYGLAVPSPGVANLILVSKRTSLHGLLIIGLVALHPAFAQVRYRPTENGPWRPWSFTAIASARQARGVTPAEVQAYQARLQELGNIVRAAPAVSQPVGFAAELWGNLDGYGPAAKGEPAGSKIPLAGSLSFGAFPLIEFMRNGKLANEDMKGGETELLLFTVNQISRGMFSQTFPGEWSGSEDAVGFTQPKTRETIAGVLTRIDDVFVLVSSKNKGRPLWIALTMEEAMAPVLSQRRQSYQNRRDVYEKQKREFAEWITPQKRAKRRADWQDAAASMKGAEGPKFLANMEKTDVELEKHHRERLAPGGPEERSVQEAERDFREAEAVLTGAPNLRSAPACYDKSAKPLNARFRPLAGAPSSCEPLVKTNWAFLDSTRPRSAPQILMVNSFDRCLKPDSINAGDKIRGGCAINRRLIDSIDWKAVQAWLDR